MTQENFKLKTQVQNLIRELNSPLKEKKISDLTNENSKLNFQIQNLIKELDSP